MRAGMTAPHFWQERWAAGEKEVFPRCECRWDEVQEQTSELQTSRTVNNARARLTTIAETNKGQRDNGGYIIEHDSGDSDTSGSGGDK